MDKELFTVGYHGVLRTPLKTTYCILTSVEGQTYTFGLHYQICGISEEFIFLPRHPRYHYHCWNALLDDDDTFRIHCANGEFYIISSKYGHVFLNGKVVLGKTKLLIGDILQIHFVRYFRKAVKPDSWNKIKSALKKIVNPSCNEIPVSPWDGCDSVEFQFRERGFKGDPHQESIPLSLVCPEVVGKALGNTLILSKIFGYLPISSLKSCRLVCSFWERESIQPLNDRTATTFRFRDYRRNNESMAFSRYLQDMKGCKPNSSLKLDIGWKERNAIYEEHKFLDDFKKFLASPYMAHSLKQLHLSASFELIVAYGVFARLLNSQMCSTIEELSLRIGLAERHWFYSDNLQYLETIGRIRVPSLKSLRVEFDPHPAHFFPSMGTSAEINVTRFIKCVIIPFCQGIKSISLTSQNPKYNSWVLSEMEKTEGN